MKLFRSVVLAATVLAVSACAGKSANLRAPRSPSAEAAAGQVVGPPTPATSVAVESTVAASDAEAASPNDDNPPDAEPAIATTVSGDETLATPAQTASSEQKTTEAEEVAQSLYAGAAVRDPWERYNRRIHRFNNVVDKHVLRPLAVGYTKAIPAPVRSGVSRFFENLSEPATVVNQTLQGHPLLALKSLGRFAVNTTLGLGGVLDPARRMGLPARDDEDLGQTLATWGWRDSRYLVMPLLGPRTVRDAFAIVGDQRLSPIAYVSDSATASALQVLEIVDGRAGMMPIDEMRRDALDDYTFVRDAWSQRRNHQIGTTERDD